MRNYQRATTYICDILEHKIGKDGEFIEKESTFAQFAFGFSEVCGVKYVKSEDGAVHKKGGYVVHPQVARHLVVFAEYDGHFYDYCLDICSTNLLTNSSIEFPLNVFCSKVLDGEVSRPVRKSRPRKKNWSEKFSLWSAVLEAAAKFDLKITRNDEGSGNFSACDAVAEGLTVCGRRTKYTEVKNIMVHPDYARHRMEFEVSQKIFHRSQEIKKLAKPLGSEQEEAILEATLDDMLDIMSTFPLVREKISSLL